MANKLTDEERFAKLPQWAQQKINLLERNVAYWMAKATEGPEDSDTFSDPHRGDGHARPLGRGTSIRFMLDGAEIDGDGWQDYIDVRLDEKGKYLIVTAGESMAVYPSSSNVIHIKQGRYYQ